MDSSFYDPSLVLYLPLWKKDGISIMSEDAYGRLCTVTGALWSSQGRVLDGVDDLMNCGSDIPNTITNQLSIEIWVKKTATGLGKFVCGQHQSTAAGYDWGIYDTTTWIFYIVNASGTEVSVTGLTVTGNNAWYHLVGVYNGANLQIYVNGNVDSAAPVAQTGNARDSGYDFLIGGWNSRFLTGIPGEQRVYSRALTAGEVMNNYLANKWRFQ